MASQPAILLTGGRSPATLELLRHLSHYGCRVFVAESDPYNLAGASRFCQGNFAVPPPAQETEAFIEALIEIIQKKQIELLIPTCEETYYISRWKRKLEAHCQVFTTTIDVLTNLHSKYQFIQLLKALELPAPETRLVTSSNQLEGFLMDWEAYVLKPEFSRFSNFVIVNEPHAEALKKAHPSEETPWVLQEYLNGPQFCSYSVAQNGKILAHSLYPSVYCAGRGATVYFESEIIPEIERTVAKIVQSLDYTGQISFDFIHTERGYLPIECNPRTTNGTYLFAAKDQLARAFVDPQLKRAIYPSETRPQMVGLAMLLYVLPKTAWFKEGPTLLKKIWAAQDAVLRLGDMSPFVSQFRSMLGYLAKARRHKVSVIEASTLDIEWNGHWDIEKDQQQEETL